MKDQSQIMKAYELARDAYAEQGVDVEQAIAKIGNVPISMHCWQGDDVIGFDASSLTGGIATTGNYPGRASTAPQLRQDMSKALSLIPGTTKVNMHASYAEKNGENIDRDAYTIKQFQSWVDWAKEEGVGMDFNPTFFSHDKLDNNFTLASPKKEIRQFWIEHGKRCREIAADMARQLGQPCVLNFWMPDGYKDVPADSKTPRERMLASLDEIFSAQDYSPNLVKDALESKLFGLGIESYTVASHEFSYGYAIARKKLYTLDAGHFHPTEVISAKISATLCYLDEILLHVSRGVRWDSDHIILLDDELQNIMKEVVRGDYLHRVNIGLDYFDASINRISAWVIGMRNARRALLMAALEPYAAIRQAENEENLSKRLALMEESKTLPFGAVWDYYCMKENVPVGLDWLTAVEQYERETLSAR